MSQWKIPATRESFALGRRRGSDFDSLPANLPRIESKSHISSCHQVVRSLSLDRPRFSAPSVYTPIFSPTFVFATFARKPPENNPSCTDAYCESKYNHDC